ncbi:MAG: YlbF family regulator [Lachnospiraceae bacterium]|nr:YlbF family regulator [Lachnospiraceae bacterium]
MNEVMEILRKNSAYRNYLEAKEKIRPYPELKEKICRLRDIFEQIEDIRDQEEEDRLRAEYEELYSNPMIREFMQAELDYCRLFQELEAEMAAELDL